MSTEALALVRALADLHPYTPNETNGDEHCFFCGAWKDGGWANGRPHSPDCVWQQAQDFKEPR